MTSDGDGPRAPPRCQGVWKTFQLTNFTVPNICCYMKYALKSSLALLMLGIPMLIGMGPELHPDVRGGGLKKIQMTNFSMLNNCCYMKYALNQFLALLILGIPMGMGWSLSSTQMSGGSGKKFQMTNFTIPTDLEGLVLRQEILYPGPLSRHLACRGHCDRLCVY